MATQTGLESFIEWALEMLAKQANLNPVLWNWVNNRDQFFKEPSVADQFDILLSATTGKSLKSETKLWQDFVTLKKIRNSIAHGGTASLNGKPIALQEVRRLIASAYAIVRWVEELLPLTERRFSSVSPSNIGIQISVRNPFAVEGAKPNFAGPQLPAWLSHGKTCTRVFYERAKMTANRIQVRWERLNEIDIITESLMEPVQLDLLMRARVPGGWLIKNTVIVSAPGKRNVSVALTFYPDPKHRWDGRSIEAGAESAVPRHARTDEPRRRRAPKRSDQR